MKRSNKILLIISITLLVGICAYLFFICTNPSLYVTDSGFDGGFGGGSHGGSGGGSSSSDGSIFDLILLLFENPLLFFISVGVSFVLIIIFSLIGDHKEKKNAKKNEKIIAELYKIYKQNEELLSKYGYNGKEVVNESFKIYKDVQIAWMNNDLDSVRDVLSDEMFNMYKTQLLTLTTEKQKNMMEDFMFINGSIKSLKEENDELSIEVKISVSCKDYVINTETNEVVKGNKNVIFYTYILTFVINKDVSTDKCPNCIATIDKNGKSIKCEYCGSIINRKSNKMVMTKKNIISEN